MSVLDVSPRALAALAPAVEALARAEGLLAHWAAVAVRVAPARERTRGGGRRRARASVPRAPPARAAAGTRRSR
jgi:histidinol dehydrogenase